MSRQSNWNLTDRVPSEGYRAGRIAVRDNPVCTPPCPYRRQFLRMEWQRGVDYERETEGQA